MTDRLVVLLPDRISDWVRKGEVVDRYLNPADRFDEVHVVLTNDDHPSEAAIARMVGSARFEVHNLPTGLRSFATTLGWRPRLLRPWVDDAVRLLERINPSLIRCHGVRLNAYAAAQARRRLGIPYVVSVHTLLDPRHHPAPSVRDRVLSLAADAVQRTALLEADRVLPVYASIVPWLESRGVTRYEVVHNPVSERVTPKTSWALDDGLLRAVVVQRQLPGKDPTPIVEAAAEVPGVHLRVIGDGSLHGRLRATVAASGAADRIELIPGMANDDVLDVLARSDAFLHCSRFLEISKSCMEACLTGLPTVVNQIAPGAVPELAGEHVLEVDGSVASYRAALVALRDDASLRERLGRAAREHGRRSWSPDRVEERLRTVYEEVMASAPEGLGEPQRPYGIVDAGGEDT